MKAKKDIAEWRQHERTYVQNLVVGILNAEEPITIGSITDISLGGVKFTYNDLRMASDDIPIQSIDLIADGYYLVDIPCAYAWNVNVETESNSNLTGLKQCGIQFGKLTPNQIFLLRSLVNHFTSLRINGKSQMSI